MPRQENKRKQYNPQETFRYTTPDVKVTARTVDAFARQRLDKVEEPSKAGILDPMQPLGLTGYIAPPSVTSPVRPVSTTVTPHATVMPSALNAVIQFANSAFPQVAQIAEKSGTERASEAYIDAMERLRSGEPADKVFAEARPETLWGFAERAYDTHVADAQFAFFEKDANKIMTDNPVAPVAEINAQLNDLFNDYAAGQSLHFKEKFIPKAANLLLKAEEFQTTALKKKAAEDFLGLIDVGFVSEVKAIQQSFDPETASQMIREKVTQLQNDGQFFGLDKDKVTRRALDALGIDLVANYEKYGSTDQHFGWTKVKDQAGVSVYDNAQYMKAISEYEGAYDRRLKQDEVDLRQDKAQRQKELVDTIENEALDVIRSGGKIHIESFLESVDSQGADYNTHKYAEQLAHEVNGTRKGESDSSTYEKVFGPLFDGNTDNLMTREEIMELRSTGQLSPQDEIAYRKALTNLGESAYTGSLKEIKGTFTSEFAPQGYVSQEARRAMEHFMNRYEELKEKSGGKTPFYSDILEIKKEAIELEQKNKGGAQETQGSPPTGLTAQEQFFFDNPNMKDDKQFVAYQKKFPEATQEEFVSVKEGYLDKVLIAMEQADGVNVQVKPKPQPKVQPKVQPKDSPTTEDEQRGILSRIAYPTEEALQDEIEESRKRIETAASLDDLRETPIGSALDTIGGTIKKVIPMRDEDDE